MYAAVSVPSTGCGSVRGVPDGADRPAGHPRLRARLFAHLLRLEAGFFDRTPVGRLMTRVLSDVEAVSEAFTSGLFAVVADVVTLAGVVAIMLWMDWRLALGDLRHRAGAVRGGRLLPPARARRLPRGAAAPGATQRLPAGVHPGQWR